MADIPKLSARKLIGVTTEELIATLDGEFILVMDDGEIRTNARETIYSSFVWDFHRMYPHTPLSVDHHVASVIKGELLKSDTHLNLLGRVMWSVYATYLSKDNQEPEAFRDTLFELLYRFANKQYNRLIHLTERYVTSLDITDYIDIINHPEIAKANAEVGDTEQSIEKAYGVIRQVLQKDPSVSNSRVAAAVRTGVAKLPQVLQCVGPRGMLTDTDSNMFRTPVKRGYVHGMRTLYNAMVESRSAAKSLEFSKAPLQQTEYFSRRLQFVSQTVQNLHFGDCGTTKTMKFKVRPALKNAAGRVEREGDLKHLAGKYFMSSQGLKAISSGDKHLEGQTIELRITPYCAHPDAHGVCSTCYGQLSLAVLEGTNLGHMNATYMTQIISQLVLSTKHHDGSASVESVQVDEATSRYIKPSPDGKAYCFADSIKKASPMLIIANADAQNLSDVLTVDDVARLNITRVTELENIAIQTSSNGIIERSVCQIAMGRRMGSLTYPMLRHIVEKGWDIDERGNFVVDLDGWDFSEPFCTLPLKHMSMSDKSNDIARLIEARTEDMERRDKVISPEAFLIELYDLVNEKLSVNLAVIEIVAYAAMIRSAENNDYALPKPWTDRGLGVMRATMENRSLSAAMAFEDHYDTITNPMSYLLGNRPDHIFDPILMPELISEK